MSETGRKKVLLNGDIHPSAMAILEARDDIEIEHLPIEREAEMPDKIKGATAVLARSCAVSAEMIASSNGLEVVSRHGVGYDKVAVDSLTARNIPLTVTGTANTPSVAEQTLMLMLAVAKGVLKTDQETRAGNFLAARHAMGRIELLEKKVLIIGFGRIGKVVTRRCQGFDMEVLACDPYIDQQLIRDAGTDPVEDFRDVLGEIDYLTVHTPLTEETRGLIGRDELARMKPTAVVVNCARGGIIDEDALYEALRDGGIYGAGIDVFDEEPTPGNHPLFTLDNIVCSPHAAASPVECLERMGVQAAQNILDVFDGRIAPEMVVNREIL